MTNVINQVESVATAYLAWDTVRSPIGGVCPGHRRREPAQTTRTTMIVVPTIDFNPLYGVVIVRLQRRNLVWISAIING